MVVQDGAGSGGGRVEFLERVRDSSKAAQMVDVPAGGRALVFAAEGCEVFVRPLLAALSGVVPLSGPVAEEVVSLPSRRWWQREQG